MVHKNVNIQEEIILQLLEANMHIREISRRIQTSHINVMRNLKELYVEGVVDFESVGKNNVYFLKKNIFSYNRILNAELYNLRKLIKKHPQLGVISEEIIKRFPNQMIIIFGSYASGNETKNSDIDIYIEAEDKKMNKEISKVNSMISVKSGEFDVENLLIKEIIKKHIILSGFERFYEKTKFFK